MTHGYVRHVTTSLFAAYEIRVDGCLAMHTILPSCAPGLPSVNCSGLPGGAIPVSTLQISRVPGSISTDSKTLC
jgi:NCAIR mutase (PurE)-related protein